jgi:hypothetical protein
MERKVTNKSVNEKEKKLAVKGSRIAVEGIGRVRKSKDRQ